MLAGVNTHIDLDLEITAQNIAPALTLPKLHGDFNTINAALAIQINGGRTEPSIHAPAPA